MASLLLDVSRGDDLSRQVQPFAQVVKALGGESVVIVLPGELGLDVAAGGEGLQSFDDLEFESLVPCVRPEIKAART